MKRWQSPYLQETCDVVLSIGALMSHWVHIPLSLSQIIWIPFYGLFRSSLDRLSLAVIIHLMVLSRPLDFPLCSHLQTFIFCFLHW